MAKTDIEARIQDIIGALNELKSDSTVPKNVKGKIDVIIAALSENVEARMKVHKALNELDNISDDNNIQSYTRAQLWNIVSMLEGLG
jgi:uncharacterized protein (UPF0147 family)